MYIVVNSNCSSSQQPLGFVMVVAKGFTYTASKSTIPHNGFSALFELVAVVAVVATAVAAAIVATKAAAAAVITAITAGTTAAATVHEPVGYKSHFTIGM